MVEAVHCVVKVGLRSRVKLVGWIPTAPAANCNWFVKVT